MKMKGTLKADKPLARKGTAAMKSGTPVRGKKIPTSPSNIITKKNQAAKKR